LAKQTHYLIEDVDEVPRNINMGLSVWNAMCFRSETIGFHYDPDTRELRIPRGYPEAHIRNTFKRHTFIYERKKPNNNTIEIGLTAAPKDYRQEHILAYMIGKEQYKYVDDYSQVYVDLDTGDGKTYAGIATICYNKCRSVIFPPATNSKICDQWVESFLKFTTLTKDDVLLVRGSQICEDILKGKYKHIKAFIMPRSTVTSFVNKYDGNWMLFDKLIESMDVGIKIFDEAHMEFPKIVLMDCFSDVYKTYYMSATPSRSKREENKIYKEIFNTIPKFGKQLKTKEQNHIIPVVIQFKSPPSHFWVKEIKTRMGPSQAKYGEYLLAEDGARDEFVDALLYTTWSLLRHRRCGGKLAIMCITKKFALEVGDILSEVFPRYKFGYYIGSSKDKYKELESDVILTTPKSMGTGADIDNLQFVFNTITYSSDGLAGQMSGRPRKREEGPTIFGDIVNMSHKTARDHYKDREKILAEKAKDGKIITHEVNNNDIMEMNAFLSKGYWLDDNGRVRSKTGQNVISRRPRL
jgi:hypothetical protein